MSLDRVVYTIHYDAPSSCDPHRRKQEILIGVQTDEVALAMYDAWRKQHPYHDAEGLFIEAPYLLKECAQVIASN